MNGAHISVALNQLGVDTKKIESFEYVNTEYDWYPSAVLVLKDYSGEMLAQFFGLQIGAKVQVTVYSDKREDGSQIVYLFPDLVVTSISDIFDSVNNFSGSIQILLKHPWELYRDYSSHAYSGKKNSAIIRNILEDSSQRGFKFAEIEDSEWKSSDENGSIPRYKCFESDFDFITKKLLPYTMCNNKVPIFWINEEGRPCLNTFIDMYSKAAGCVAIPDSPGFISQNEVNLSTQALKSEGKIFTYETAFLKIGDEDAGQFLKMLKTRVVYENNLTGKAIFGIQKPRVALKKATLLSTTDGSRLPVDMESFADMNESDVQVFRYKNLDDAIALSKNMQTTFNQFFRLELRGNFAGDVIGTGQNMNIFVNPLKGTTMGIPTSSRHWLEDKWHVYGIRHFYHYQTKNVKSVVLLERPSFLLKKLKTSVIGSDMLYFVTEV